MSLLVSASSPSPLFARSPNGLTGFGVGENFEQLDRAVTQSDQSLHPSESLTAQVEIFEEYLSPQERFKFDDMFEIARSIQDPTRIRQPRSNLAHDIVLQHCDGEIFGPHQDQCHLAESLTPHIEYPPERLADISLTHSLTWNPSRGHYFQIC